jgi:stage V sporulation protein G
MQISRLNIFPLHRSTGNLIGFAEVVIDESLVIRDIRILSSSRGNFIGMPSRKMPDGTWKEVVLCIDSGLEERIKSMVLRAYEDEINRPEAKFGKK